MYGDGQNYAIGKYLPTGSMILRQSFQSAPSAFYFSFKVNGMQIKKLIDVPPEYAGGWFDNISVWPSDRRDEISSILRFLGETRR